MKKINVVIFILLVGLFFITAITHKYGPYYGKVLDEQTGQPLEGAVVYIVVHTNTPNPGGYTSVTAGAKEVITNSKGEFNLFLRSWILRPFSFWSDDVAWVIYKPGYGAFPRHKKTYISPESSYKILKKEVYNVVYLPKLHTARERRDNYLHNVDLRRSSVPYSQRAVITDLLDREVEEVNSRL